MVNCKVGQVIFSIQTTDADIVNFVIVPGLYFRVNYPPGSRTLDGLEDDKAFVLEADGDVTVKVLNENPTTQGDVALVHANRADSVEFFVNSPVSELSGDCNTGESTTYNYMVFTALQTDTNVNIFDQEGTDVETIQLVSWQAYTYRQTYSERSTGFNGYRILSNKPITVGVGSSCLVSGNPEFGSPTFDNIPPITRLGLNHIIPPITSPFAEVQTYTVQVVAVNEIETTLRMTNEETPIKINRGQVFSRDYNSFDFSAILCDYPCSVTMTTSNAGPTFMTHIPAVEFYSREIYFSYATATNAGPLSRALSVVTPSLNFGALFLNGNSLGNVLWDCTGDVLINERFCVTEINIVQDTFQVEYNNIDRCCNRGNSSNSKLMYLLLPCRIFNIF